LPVSGLPPPDVPERYRGVWRRSLLQTPLQRDTQTWVRWLQTASWHADLRVPVAARPAPLPGQPGAQPSPQQLAAQQGFLGRTRVERATRAPGDGLPEAQGSGEGPAPAVETCTWERHLDFQPPGLHPDAGRIDFDGPDRLIEVGVHGDYLEHWERLPGSTGRHAVLERRLDGSAERTGSGAAALRPEWLLLSGDFLMRVRPRAAPWPADTEPGASLASVLQRHPAQQASWLDFEIAFGVLHEGCWTIEQATLPGLVGSVHPMQLCRSGASEAAVSPERSLAAGGLWRVHEWSEVGELLR